MATKHAGIILQHVRKILSAHEIEQLCDRDLLRRFIQERDEVAFATLVRRHGRMVLQSCQRVLHNQHDAEDGFQATFLVLARKAASRRWKESVGPWLHLVAYRLALKIRAGRDRQLPRNPHPVERASEDPLAVASSHELGSVLDEELSRLPEKCRAPLVLCSLNGLSRDEAARQLGWSLGTFRRRLEQGRALLRQRLVRRGLPLSAIFAAVLGTEEAVQAAVPLGLAQSAVQLAMQSALGTALPTTLLSARAAALAEGVLKGMCVSKLKAALAAVLVLGIAGAGASLVWQQLSAVKSVEENLSEPERWARQEPLAAQPGFDRYGDPLPTDAVTRLGTSRFWCGPIFQTQVSFTADGGTIVAASSCGAFAFDTTTGKQFRHINTWTAKRNGNFMSVSPDGQYVALATNGWDDNAGAGIQVWDLATGQLVRECQDDSAQHYLSVRFSPDGKLLAANSDSSKTLYLWDPATGREIRRWRLASGFWDCFAFSPDSKTLIVGDQRMIHFWDTATGEEVRRMDDHPGSCVYRLFLTQDGKILATQALTADPNNGEPFQEDNTVHLWDVATGKKLRHIMPDPSRLNYFQFSPDTKSLATASNDRVLRIWDVATGKELRRWDTSRWVHGFAFSPDGKKLASLGSGDNTVHLWDAATGKELREHPSQRTGIYGLSLSPDGRTLASASWVASADRDRQVYLWDTSTGQQQGQLAAANGFARALDFSADGRTLTTLGDDAMARVWDVATGKELRQFPAPAGPQHGIAPDGKTWASASGFDLVLWDAATGKKRHDCAGHKGITGALGFSPDGGTLYSWSYLDDAKVQFWDVGTGTRLRAFAADRAVSGLHLGSFSPNGNWSAFGGHGELLLLYDMATGTAVHRLEVPAIRYGNSRGFAISPDSRTLAIGDEAGTIHLVELASGKFRRRWVGGHQGNINALLFSADGTRLISGSSDTTALVWDLTGRRNASGKPLGVAELDACWTDLVNEDAERAYQSIRLLAASPAEMVPYLGRHLQPAASVDAREVDRRIVDLASNRFAVRARAFEELEKLGEAATAACRKALASEPSLELRRRLEMLVEKQERERRSPSPERLRMLRALEALELTGTPPSRQLLQKLAAGASEASITQEAKAALGRLARQPVGRP